MADIEKSFKSIVKKGSVVFGSKQTKSSIMNGKAKLVVLSENCPTKEGIIADADKKKIPVYTSSVDSVELGYLCGRSYGISSFAILDDGGVNIHHLIKKG